MFRICQFLEVTVSSVYFSLVVLRATDAKSS